MINNLFSFFQNDDKMSLKQIEDKLGEHPPRKLTARIDRLPMGNVIYFKQKTFCKTAFLINAKNCHFQDNKNLLKCKSISKDYKNNIDLMHGIQQLCRSPNITLAFNAPNDTVYLFRFKQYWVFGMDKQQAIGDLISGPYDAAETWKGWRLDNDGFFYDEKKFIMFYQNKWWSWKEDGQSAVTESALYEGEHLDAEEREKMKQEKEQKKQKEKEKREKEEEKRREEERKQRADKEKKKYEERQKKRKNGPEVDKTALKHLCWDLNIADGDIDMNNDLYVFKDEFYWKLEHQNGEFFVTKQGQSKNKWKKFQPNPSAVARIIEPGQRRVSKNTVVVLTFQAPVK